MNAETRAPARDPQPDGTAAVLDLLSFGVLLLDAAGSVRQANRMAAALIALNDGLTLRDSVLHALRAGDDERLHALIAGVAAAAHGGGSGASDSLAIPRRSGRRAYALRFAPLPARTVSPPASAAGVIVFLRDPDSDIAANGCQIAPLFQLTPREGELAARLLTGDSLADAARALGIGSGTARNRLAALFAKTRTHRQGELVALLARSTLGLR